MKMIAAMLNKIIFVFLLCLFTSAYADNTTTMEKKFIDNNDVIIFINQMETKHQFKKSYLMPLFSAVKIRPKIVQTVKVPFEQKPWYIYKLSFVTEKRIAEGLIFWDKYADALSRAEKTYGVPASIIVATIGIETKYGRETGEFPVFDALVNLAFNNTYRSTFFRNELEEFLLLTREQHLNPLTVMGSYAGAIGQPQFMPSSYRHYAINFSGNPTIDLSHNEVDVIGSIANYYKKNGWKTNQPIAIPVSNEGGKFQLGLSRPKKISMSELIENGMIADRNFLNDNKNKLIVLQSDYGNEYWFGFHNFDVIKRYNHSELYAMAIYQLSYHLAVLRENSNHE